MIARASLPPPVDNTADLLTRARAGERDAFDRLFARTLPRLEWFLGLRIGARLGHQVEVADLIQETYAAAFDGLDRFEHRGPGSFLRWLFALAGNQVRRAAERQGAHHRRRQSTGASAASALALAADPATGPCTRAERHEARARLQSALESLDDELREALVLRVLEERPLAEVAHTLERSESAVRRLVAKGLVALGQSLGQSPGRSLDREVPRG